MTPQIKQRIEQIQRGDVPDGYKKTKVGIVPAEWAVCNMGNIYSERKESGDPNLPILTVSIHSGVSSGELNESELGKKVKRIEDKTQYLTARNGDLVFNMMRAWQGAIGVAQADGLVSPAYIVAKPIIKLNPAFMDKYIKLPESINSLHKKSYGVTDFRLRLYWDSFIKVDCCLPPLPEQEKIAEILMTQDRVIELCEKKVEQLKKLKKAFMQKMFPKPGCNVPEWRFPKFNTPWIQCKLGDVLSIATRKNGDLFTKEDVLSVSDEFGCINQILFHGRSFAGADISNYKIVKTGDIVYTRSPLQAKPYGIIKIVGVETGIVSPLYIINEAKEGVSPKFIYYSFDTPKKTNNYLSLLVRKGAKNTMNISNEEWLSGEIMIAPGYEEQQKIGNFFETIDNLISLHQRKCDEEKQKKKALMQLLLTGIVRVKT